MAGEMTTTSRSWGYSESESSAGSASGKSVGLCRAGSGEVPPGLARSLEDEIAFLQRALSHLPDRGFIGGDSV
jgi:hypothetical protein